MYRTLIFDAYKMEKKFIASHIRPFSNNYVLPRLIDKLQQTMHIIKSLQFLFPLADQHKLSGCYGSTKYLTNISTKIITKIIVDAHVAANNINYLIGINQCL